MNEDKRQEEPPTRRIPFSKAFKEFIVSDWAPYPDGPPDSLSAASWTPARRKAISAMFPGKRLVIPSGPLKVRANDSDYRYRPHSAFTYLTGLGTDREPDAVLVLEPTNSGHEATLYFKPRAPRTDEEFYASSRYGEMWVGKRESLAEMTAMTGLHCAPLSEFDLALAKNIETTQVLVLRDADPEITAKVDKIRGESLTVQDQELNCALSEVRLYKDDFEIAQMKEACAATKVGFEAVIKQLPEAVSRGRGERWVEGIFGLHARHLGNAVGYDTISAAGDDANTLHWIRNDRDINNGDLLLLDAGVELDSLYTADVTRTLPVNGKYSPAQREVYEAVLEAQEAGIAACKPGNKFFDVHNAAIKVVATHLYDWGILPCSVEEAISDEGGQYRRWMVHGTSHHLGLDVHDCAQARQENYRGQLKPGMMITVEPGIYFKSIDLLVPEKFRGIGVRIEDDILITEDGCEVMSSAIPKDPTEVESWMANLMS